jgi:hypothetical protein
MGGVPHASPVAPLMTMLVTVWRRLHHRLLILSLPPVLAPYRAASPIGVHLPGSPMVFASESDESADFRMHEQTEHIILKNDAIWAEEQNTGPQRWAHVRATRRGTPGFV